MEAQRLTFRTELTAHATSLYLNYHARQFWPLCGAIFGLCGGALAPLAGSILTAVSWGLRNPSRPAIHQWGTILLLATIPLLLLGGYSMDSLEAVREPNDRPRRR